MFCNDPPPTRDEVTNNFWSACHGGQLATAEYLRERGADLKIGNLRWPHRPRCGEPYGASELVRWLCHRGSHFPHDRKSPMSGRGVVCCTWVGPHPSLRGSLTA